MISPAVHNLGIVNHFMITLIVYVILKNEFKTIASDIVCGIAIYVDPTLILLIAPVRLITQLIESKGETIFSSGVLKTFIICLTIWILLVFVMSGDW